MIINTVSVNCSAVLDCSSHHGASFLTSLVHSRAPHSKAPTLQRAVEDKGERSEREERANEWTNERAQDRHAEGSPDLYSVCCQENQSAALLSLKVTEAGYRSVTSGSRGRICLTPCCRSPDSQEKRERMGGERHREWIEGRKKKERERERQGGKKCGEKEKNCTGKMNGKLNLKYAGICWAALGPSLGFSYLIHCTRLTPPHRSSLWEKRIKSHSNSAAPH